MNIVEINRRFYDEYFRELVDSTAEIVKIPIYYECVSNQWIDLIPDEPVLVFLSDYLTDGVNYTRWDDHCIRVLKSRTAPLYVATSVYGADSDFDLPNVIFLHTGSDMLFQKYHYPECAGVTHKLFDKDYHWCFLSLIPRLHRTTASCMLYGLNVPNGCIRVDSGVHDNNDWSDYYHLPVNINHTQEKILNKGWQTFVQQHFEEERYNVSANHNSMNYLMNLRDIYKNTCVEIVNETTYFNNGIFVSEKYLNSVYGYNFPLVLSNCGTVDYLRNNGFDMFDDIIDHSYDREPDPLKRMFKMIEDNAELLSNRNHALYSWLACKKRFAKNLDFAKHHMYNHFANNFLSQLKAYSNIIN